jgi:hypothetical protein
MVPFWMILKSRKSETISVSVAYAWLLLATLVFGST